MPVSTTLDDVSPYISAQRKTSPSQIELPLSTVFVSSTTDCGNDCHFASMPMETEGSACGRFPSMEQLHAPRVPDGHRCNVLYIAFDGVYATGHLTQQEPTDSCHAHREYFRTTKVVWADMT